MPETFGQNRDNTLPQPAPMIMAGIDVHKLNAGDTILLEADTGIYELQIIDPVRKWASVSGTEPRLRKPTVCSIQHSTSVLNPLDKRDGWIGHARRLTLGFRNLTLETGAILTASVRGAGWHYDVF